MKNNNYFLVLVSVFLLVSLQGFSQQRVYRSVSMPATPGLLQRLDAAAILPAHFHERKGQLEMELDPAEYARLQQSGLPFQTLAPPVVSGADPALLLAQRQQTESAPLNFSLGSMGGYYTYAEAMAILDDMRVKFPQLVSGKDTLGYTHEGRPLVAVRISDNPDVVETGEDEWLMTALHHSNEVMGMSVLYYYVWYLLEHYEDDAVIKKLLNHSALYIIPVVNPDGLAYNESTNPAGGGTWRKNRKPRVIGATTHYGVDLNRNYGYNWAYSHAGQLGQAGSNFAGNSYYRGTAAWSEQETSLLRDFCQSRNFTAAFNYHAWDDSFNYPWNYDIDEMTEDKNMFFALADYLTEDNLFEKGTFNQTLGYTANGTSDDWMYGEQGSKNKIFPFTIEVGKSFWPSPDLILTYGDSLLQANLKMLRMAARYAEATETSPSTINALTGTAVFSLKRYSILDSTFTVTLEPLGGPDIPITVTGAPVVYGNLGFLEDRAGGIISYSVPASTPNNTTIRFLLRVDNGTWSVVDTISKLFMGHSTLPLGCENTAEPNDQLSQAVPLVPGTIAHGAIERSGDPDWYYTDVQARESLRFVLSGLPADFDIELLDASGKQVATGEQPFKVADTIVLNHALPGRYYLRVYGYRNAFDLHRCYRLSVETRSHPYPEPVPATGKQRRTGAVVRYQVGPVPARQEITVRTVSSRPGTVSWTLTDYGGRRLRGGLHSIQAGTSFFSIPVQELAAGAYLLQLQADASSGPPESFRVLRE